jgi:hypothetical protein
VTSLVARFAVRFALPAALVLVASTAKADGDADLDRKPGPDRLNPYPAPQPKIIPQPERAYSYQQPVLRPTLLWMGAQLIPSPELAFGQLHQPGPLGSSEERSKTAFGLRWQLTPLLWSWGVNRHASRWRYFVVDPLARHSGSLELSGTFEYIFGFVERFLVRPGVRAYFPIAQRGEYLSVSVGTSTYAYDDRMRVAYDFGVYSLAGIFGLQATVAPYHGPLTMIGTFRIKYF